YTFDNRDTPSYDKQSPDEQASMAGLRYQYAEKSNVYVNAQQTFRFLATDEFYDIFSGLNTALRPQKGWQYEAGVKHSVNDTLVLHVTPYYITNKDEIFFEPLINFGFGSNSNYDRTRRMGIELGQELDLLKLADISGFDQMEFFTNYTFQKPQFEKGAFKDNDIPMAPRHMASAGLKTAFLKNIHLSLSGNYVGPSFAINDTRNALPKVKPYFIADTRLSYDRQNWELFFGVNNLFDKKYFNYVIAQANGGTNSDYYPAPERNYNVGMNLKF
ncbi:MAG: TonB-dependent receptor, partial [Candidatus Omnitrophica bacterium]|nr:TonB-dependent receptor [Candidatus Omnitrophota bacterium]